MEDKIERFSTIQSKFSFLKDKVTEAKASKELLENQLNEKMKELDAKYGIKSQEDLAAMIKDCQLKCDNLMNELDLFLSDVQKVHPEVFEAKEGSFN